MSNEPLQRRYGGSVAELPNTWNAVIETLLAHRSVRSYLPTPLPPGTLEILVAAAQSAATSSNLQSWSLVAVDRPQSRQRLAEIAGGQRHIVDAPLFLVWLADLSRARRQAQRKDAQLEALEHLESLLFSSVDAALAAQNAVVALESLGLSSVYIGALRNDIAAVSDLLDLPENTYPVFGLCVGYADPASDVGVKPRLPQQAVLHRETYSARDEDQLVDEYSARLRRYYQTQRLPDVGWPELILKRLQHATTLGGRVRLPRLLRKRGFSLD